MKDTDARFAGSIPAIYEQLLEPMFFEPYAEDIAARLRGIERGAVLEVAAGTGIVTRALAKALPPEVRIVATDLNDDMLEIAARRAAAPSVTWRQADAQRLPFADAEFDAVICQFGMMFLPDKLSGYREARRVLKRGARFVFNVWDSLARNEVSQIASRTVAGMFDDDPPRFLERTPFAYFDPAVIRSDLEAAGFSRIEIEPVEKTTRAASADDAAVGLCKGTPLRTEIEARAPARMEELIVAASNALGARFGRSSFENRMRALVVTASAP